MGDTVWVAIIAFLSLLVSGMIGPVVVSVFASRQRRIERLEDYARQDLVAERAKEVADSLYSFNKSTDKQLRVIHDLVNSNYTAAIQATLEAMQAKLHVMVESIEFRRSRNAPVPPEMVAEIERTHGGIANLERTLAERASQQEQINGTTSPSVSRVIK